MIDKQHILDEIQRTARANGGMPLGRLRFRKETGIGEYDWSKYWSRWGDAQREAGFAPNEKITGYGDELLIGRFISLMRELGKFPTFRELRLKSSQDPEFPNEASYRRFGRKADFAAQIARYCRQHPEHDDIVPLCAAAIQEATSRQEADDTLAAREELGFVYLLRSGRNYKIGKTNAVGRRERELAIQLPERADVVHSIKTDDPAGIEAYWHGRFADKRKGGEWFALSAADVQAFKRRKFM